MPPRSSCCCCCRLPPAACLPQSQRPSPSKVGRPGRPSCSDRALSHLKSSQCDGLWPRLKRRRGHALLTRHQERGDRLGRRRIASLPVEANDANLLKSKQQPAAAAAITGCKYTTGTSLFACAQEPNKDANQENDQGKQTNKQTIPKDEERKQRRFRACAHPCLDVSARRLSVLMANQTRKHPGFEVRAPTSRNPINSAKTCPDATKLLNPDSGSSWLPRPVRPDRRCWSSLTWNQHCTTQTERRVRSRTPPRPQPSGRSQVPLLSNLRTHHGSLPPAAWPRWEQGRPVPVPVTLIRTLSIVVAESL